MPDMNSQPTRRTRSARRKLFVQVSSAPTPSPGPGPVGQVCEVIGEFVSTPAEKTTQLLEALPEVFTAREFLNRSRQVGLEQTEALALLGALTLVGAISRVGVLLVKELSAQSPASAA